MPGDTWISHRAIILAAMARGRPTITGCADGDDVRLAQAAVEAFGAGVGIEEDRITIDGGPWLSCPSAIECGNSGTTARLLVDTVAGMPGVRARFMGDHSLGSRPMARLIDPLRRMGAIVSSARDRLPPRCDRNESEVQHPPQPAGLGAGTTFVPADQMLLQRGQCGR